MKLLLAFLLLATQGWPAEIQPAKRTIINLGGGSDPTKLPLTGGTVSPGGVFYSTSSTGVVAGGVYASTPTFGGLTLIAQPGDLGASIFNLSSGGGSLVIFLSTSVNPDINTTPAIQYDPASGEVSIFTGENQGSLLLEPNRASLTLEGNSGFQVWPTSAAISGNRVVIQAGGGVFASDAATNDFSLGVTKLNALIAKALCLNASGTVSTCTSAVTPTGFCTCP